MEYVPLIYSYTNAIGNIVFSYNLVFAGTSGFFSAPLRNIMPYGATLEAIIHTHGGYLISTKLSKLDKGVSERYGVEVYLALKYGGLTTEYDGSQLSKMLGE